MDLTELSDFLKIANELPANLKIIFITIFLLAPKIIQLLGGDKVIKAGFAAIWSSIMEIIRRYQSRKARQVEDDGLTQAYTRTLVVESLNVFSNRLALLEEKVDLLLEYSQRANTTEKVNGQLQEELRRLRNLVETRLND